MAHGKIRVNTLTYDTGSGDVDVAVSAIPTGTIPTNSDIDARITAAVGSTVQAFDGNTAKTDVAQTFGPAQTFTAASVHNGGLAVDGRYSQVAEAVSALDIDMSTGNYFTKSISTSSTITFSNPPATGTVGSFILQLTLTGTGTLITWPGTVYWNNDAGTTAPTLIDSRTHLFLFVTSDGGTTYRGSVLKDYTN